MAAPGRLRRRARAVAGAALLLGLPAAAVGVVYLRIYVSNRFAFPVGYDTPKYLWRSALVSAKGVASLAGAAPQPFRSNPDRAGFPVLLNTVASLLRVTVPHLVIVLPAVTAAAIGLGGGAFATLALRLPRWSMPVFVVAVGASANVSRMAGPGYNDNLVLTTVAMAAAAVAVLAAGTRSRTGAWASAGAIVLLTAGVLTHWIFVALFVAILAAVAALAVPASMRQWRASGRPIATPTGRLAGIIGGSAIVGALGLTTLVSTEPSPPHLPEAAFGSKLAMDVPRYVFPVTGLLAALGAMFVWPWWPRARRAPEDAPPLGAWLTLVWASTGAVAVALLAAGLAIPAHRFLAFDLGIPLLIGAGVVGVAGLIASRRSAAAPWIAVALVLVVLAGTSTIASRAWSSTHPWIPAKQFEQAGVAGSYLQRVGGSRPVVFIVDLGGAAPLASTSEAFHVIRTALAPTDIRRTLEYLGTPQDFLAGRPTLRHVPSTFDQASLQHWPSVRAVLDQRPIALMMPAFSRGFAATVAAHPAWRVAPGLAVVQGPRPSGTYAPLLPVPTPLSAFALAALWTAFLAVLTVVGGGWSGAFVRSGALAALALSPAFGVATIVLGGTVADRFGVRPTGAPGALIALAVGALGWVLFGLTRPRRGPQAAPEAELERASR